MKMKTLTAVKKHPIKKTFKKGATAVAPLNMNEKDLWTTKKNLYKYLVA